MYSTGLAYNISGQNVLANEEIRRSVVLNKYLYETIRLLSNSMPSSSSISKLPLTNSKQGATNFYIDYTNRYRSLRSRNNSQAKHIGCTKRHGPRRDLSTRGHRLWWTSSTRGAMASQEGPRKVVQRERPTGTSFDNLTFYEGHSPWRKRDYPTKSSILLSPRSLFPRNRREERTFSSHLHSPFLCSFFSSYR